MSDLLSLSEGDFDIVADTETFQEYPDEVSVSSTEGSEDENFEAEAYDNSVFSETVSEYGVQYDNVSDFQENPQEIVIMDNPISETSENTAEPETSSNETVSDSELSIIGIVLNDSEKRLFFENQEKQEEFETTVLDFLKEEQELNEAISAYFESSKENNENLLAKEEEILNALIAIADNQKELTKSLRINNTLTFSLVFGVLLLLGAMFANMVWQRFQ